MLSFSPASLTGCLSFVVPGSLFWETFYYLLSFMAIPDLCTSEQTEDDVFLKAVKQTSLAVQWLRLQASTAGVLVQSLVWELRSHMLHSQIITKN